MMIRAVCAMILMVLAAACSGRMSTADRQEYEDQLSNWHASRIADLKKENGWLNLAGLFWLEEGVNSFGSDPSLQIVFPVDFPLKDAGYFLVRDGSVTLISPEENGIQVSGKTVGEASLFYPDSVNNRMAAKGHFRWTIIRRQGKLAVRLRDLSAEGLDDFKGPDRFPVDPEFRVQGRLVATDTLRTILISNVFGHTVPERSPGWIEFTLNGDRLRLDALESEGDLFLVFADATTGSSTYAGGRFLYAEMPGPDGMVELDFNKAINPPCVFTPYATCPLPPPQNRLPVAVHAGEKDYHR